ncbi:fatty-acid synthase II [Corynebacterium renale]|uniref:Fatty acid synthase n=1 Tax=Corynebacterium renale TaxID=1724 RepID=A0A2A9DQD3_9CORY|nr:fatty acid synthase [Corynebacterium renale]SQI20467.1 fatty-acid synthase II [Corynebacterium renale]
MTESTEYTIAPQTLANALGAPAEPGRHTYAVAFAGQGFLWLTGLQRVAVGAYRRHVADMLAGAEDLLAPVAGELRAARPRGFSPLDWADREEGPQAWLTEPAVSVPGITLTQLATVVSLEQQGLDLSTASGVYGHSQGVLAADWVGHRDAARTLALAQLIGAAVSRYSRIHGLRASSDGAPMVLVRGVAEEALRSALALSAGASGEGAAVGLRNGRQSWVVVGRPADTTAVAEALASADGEVEVEELPIAAAFHHPLLSDGVDQVVEWAATCGLDEKWARGLAEAVMTRPVDWPAELAGNTADWILDLGPDTGMATATEKVVAGRGVGVIAAGTDAGQDLLFRPGAAPARPRPWSDWAPSIVDHAGQPAVRTRFTELTGRSVTMLPGMTPSTVDPHIVAAAANAGHWAELAGGGQVTPAILEEHLAQLEKLLEDGAAAQFNAMFLNPEQWRMHIEGSRLVPKARATGAPIDGITISAGMPETEEAVALVKSLRADGFPWVAFKPGAANDIRAVLRVAARIPEIPIILQVEGGMAGGHHSWEDLDGLLLDTYAEIRAHENVVLTVGGGIGTPEVGAAYVTGSWAQAYGMPAMPVDAIMLGTVAMAAQESTASPSVKEALVNTRGGGDWIPAGGALGDMASGLSQLGADIYEINNSFARAGRLLDEVAGDAEAVEARRAEIITAINKTCKPYFGDPASMTYQQWLDRYLELAGPDGQHWTQWVDVTWRDRFVDMLKRTEARLTDSDHGTFEPVLDYSQAEVAPREVVAKLLEAYPAATTDLLTSSDAQWFIARVSAPGKPANFVPVIDADVRRRWRSDSLWQAHDPKYDADQVCIIPGPVAVAGITRADEPVADIFARFNDAIVATVGQEPVEDSRTAVDMLLDAPTVSWAGRHRPNAVRALGGQWQRAGNNATHPSGAVLRGASDSDTVTATWCLDYGRTLTIDFEVSSDPAFVPRVSAEAATSAMKDLTLLAAGGLKPEEDATGFRHEAELQAADIADYQASTADGQLAPDVLVGLAWPAIFAAVSAAQSTAGEAVVEGMLSLVHLDHTVSVHADITPGRYTVTADSACVTDTEAGRIVAVCAELTRAGEPVATLSERFMIRGRVGTEHLPTAEPARDIRSTPSSQRGELTVIAPQTMDAFAAVTGDHNPIHTSVVAAQLAGLPGVIVHGMWTSAVAEVAAQLGGGQIAEFSAQMVAPVFPGQEVRFTVDRTGVDTRTGRGEVRTVTATVDGSVVLTGTATMAEPTTFYGFPGQGIQSPGMGMEARARSAAAREVWDRADAHTRKALGFSIVDIVANNPAEVVVNGERFHHPDGVLYLTQFTQVAMATLGVAQVAELEEAGVLVQGAYFAGHSVGEYNALAAYAQVLSLEAVLEIVYRRGLTMDRLVERDVNGNSNYGLAALRPNKMGLSADDVFEHVATISQRTGEFLEIVNYNIDGVQYAVAGTRAGLHALREDAERRAPGLRAFIPIPGIDVPFHSSQLRDGVPAFRKHLDSLLPDDVNESVLAHRYIPNLVARPFELTDDFLGAMLEVVDSPLIRELLQDPERFGKHRTATARTMLVELLAWQFASPVRWIETQALVLSHLPVDRVVEIGVGSSPTLANMFGQTLRLPQYAGATAEIFNVERDRALVFAEDEALREEPLEDTPAEAPVETHTEPAPVATTPEPAPAPASGATGDTPDLTFTAADAVTMLIALWTKVRPDQMGDTDNVESLVEGVSSRRNQLLLDLGVEFGVGAIDGAADAPLPQLREQVTSLARGYQAFGPVLKETVADALRRLTGPAGKKPGYVAQRIESAWGLGPGWVTHVIAALVMGTREGASLRGGELAVFDGDLDSTIDAAVNAVAAEHGMSVAKAQANSGGGQQVDSAALDEFAATITGEDGVLASTARHLLRTLGVEAPAPVAEIPDTELEDLVAAELGPQWAHTVTPRFDARRAVLLDDRWASAREDVAQVGLGLCDESEVDVTGTGDAVAAMAEYYGLTHLAEQARDTTPGEFAGDIAVVTGASPNSIAASVTARLLAGGATVIATTNSLNHDRLEFYKDLYRKHARGGAVLWIVAANLASFSDVDSLISWIGSEQTTTVGAESVVTKPAMVPTLVFPFAAPPVSGTAADAGPVAENQMRLLVWSVERLVTGLSSLGADTHIGHRMHVVLPGSPNRGRFGGDGAYGEAKAALDAFVTRWHAEPVWGQRTSLVHALIGWVRGTGLMGGNDPLVEAVEKLGVRTYSTDEIAAELIAAALPEVRMEAATGPVTVDLTGGLGEADIDLPGLARSVHVTAGEEAIERELLDALPAPARPLPQTTPEFDGVTQKLEDMVVIVGAGELSPLGSSRTRYDVELGGQLSAGGVAELAWSMGLITWDTTGRTPGWIDADGNEIPETEIYDRFHDEVWQRIGVRRYHDDFGMVDNLAPELTTIYLDHDLTFTVADRGVAETFRDSEPATTVIAPADPAELSGEWLVTRQQGSAVRVPRRMAMTRFVGGQIPEGFDPARYGIPADMCENLDRVALWNLVCTVDAFISSGFSPAELLAHVHPARVSSTQGTGMGGMESLRGIYVDRLLDEPRANDVLQEALPNVIAAHVMQDYVGGYGQMVHPVAACATAAVSIEEGMDKIRLGKADVVVTGGYDDLGVEGITGFGNMAATADSAALEARGIDHRYFSRANDRRRAGFVESEGGGTIVLARATVAADLGLPVLAVVGFAESFADGAHTSIPAPGLGALSAARGSTESRLAHALAEVGVSADDIAVISKHDTSTNANDPNESDLHERIAAELGRTPGKPLFVVSQKTLTGHAKGGAAAFQLVGLTQVLRTGIIPPNRSLDCVDPALAQDSHMVWLRKRLAAGNLKAGLVTSLGFGHVSALVALVHPAAFITALRSQRGAEAANAWQETARERERDGQRRLDDAMHGGHDLYQRPLERNLGAGPGRKEREAAVLLSESSRLVDGKLVP